jgi:hypothetical protein
MVFAQNPSDVKEQLADHGVTITTLYGAVLSDLDSVSGQGGTYSGNLNVQVSLDGDRLFGRSGLTLFVDGLWIHGGQPSVILGDAQGSEDTISTPSSTASSRLDCSSSAKRTNASAPRTEYELLAVVAECLAAL